MVVDSSENAIAENDGAPLRFITRQQERNRKKKLQKKLAKQRKREQANNKDGQLMSEITSTKSSNNSPVKEYPHFELTGSFERFKVIHGCVFCLL